MLTVIDLGFLYFEEHNLYRKIFHPSTSPPNFARYYGLLVTLRNIIQGLEGTK